MLYLSIVIESSEDYNIIEKLKCGKYLRNNIINCFIKKERTMKKGFYKIVSVILSVLMLVSLTACTKDSGENIIDDENTLNVKIRKAGNGTTYITALKEKFEETFAAEGYKINVLSPREDLSSTNVYRDIYSGSGIDVYFTSDIEAEAAVDGDFGQTFADITSDVYEKPAIKFDGSEETTTIKEKLSFFMMDEAFYKEKCYGLPYSLSIGGLAVNKKVLDDNQIELPRTSNEMLAAADKIMTKVKSTDQFPFAFALTGNNYVHSTINAWIAQYGGVEEYNTIWSFDKADGTPLENVYEVYEYDSLKYALEIVYNFYDYNMAAWGCATSDFSTVQGKLMKGDAAFYSVGDWMFNEEFERYSNYLNDVTFINTPVVSALGVKLFGAGTSYDMSDADADKTLSTIIKYADQNKLAEEIKPLVDEELGREIKIQDVTTVCERRGIARMNASPGLVISEKSPKKDLAKLFLRFCASEDAGKVFAEEAKTASPYSYKTPIDSEYEWIQSANRIALNPYLTQIESKNKGTRKKLGVTLFPVKGEYFASDIYEQSVTKYDEGFNIVKSDSVYLNAAIEMLEAEYEYAKGQIDDGKWQVNG